MSDEEQGHPAAPNVADLLIDIRAVGIEPGEPFTFASGLRSPMYCDNRIFLSHPEAREKMLDQLCRLIEQTAGGDWDAVAGVATSGIPFAAWVAMKFNKPMVYIRPAEKEHGRQRRIEGGLAPGQRVILIEDLVTTGGSAIAAVTALREAGFSCDRCFSIFDYGFSAAPRKFAAEQIEHNTLTDLDALLDTMRQRNLVPDSEIERVRRWHERADAAPTTA